MKTTSLEGNTQLLDGGAMFGNAPKEMWKKIITPNEKNQIPLSCRSLLIEDGDKKILLEAGIGTFFSPKLKERFGVQEKEHILIDSLKSRNLNPEDITHIILSHLHFDHAGGILTPYIEDTAPSLLFKNANFFVSKEAFLRAKTPHFRDRASYISELPQLLEDTNKLYFIENKTHHLLGDSFSFEIVHGHTPGMLLTTVTGKEKSITFMADLIPGTPWVHLPLTMGYDRFPELVIDEKERILKKLLQTKGYLFYTHDSATVASLVERDERGRFQATELESTWEDVLL